MQLLLFVIGDLTSLHVALPTPEEKRGVGTATRRPRFDEKTKGYFEKFGKLFKYLTGVNKAPNICIRNGEQNIWLTLKHKNCCSMTKHRGNYEFDS